MQQARAERHAKRRVALEADEHRLIAPGQVGIAAAPWADDADEPAQQIELPRTDFFSELLTAVLPISRPKRRGPRSCWLASSARTTGNSIFGPSWRCRHTFRATPDLDSIWSAINY